MLVKKGTHRLTEKRGEIEVKTMQSWVFKTITNSMIDWKFSSQTFALCWLVLEPGSPVLRTGALTIDLSRTNTDPHSRIIQWLERQHVKPETQVQARFRI